MQKAVGWILVVAGLVAAALGAAVMAVLGPDNRLTTGPHEIDADGVAVVTAPGAIRWSGVQIDVLVRVPVNKPVFVGVGHSVDVQDYVDQVQRVEITAFSTPWEPSERQVKGQPSLDAAPTAMDWWLASQAGLGGAAISYELPDETVSLAVLAVGTTDLSGLEVELAYGIKGGFGRGLGLCLIGLGAVWLGWLVRAGGLWRSGGLAGLGAAEPQPGTPGFDRHEAMIEEEVFVWVDDDGIEHELTADQLASLGEYEVIEEVEPADVPPPVGRPTTIAEVLASRPDAPPTAGQIAAGSDNGPEASVMFVWVDDDGVEHEVPPEELDGYEIVDEEDQP